MSKKIDKLRRMVGKLKRRYGEQDEDVRHLQLELDTLVALAISQRLAHGVEAPDRYNFQSLAKQQYYASKLENQH